MNSKYFILNRQLLKVVGIVFVALLLSLGMQSTAFAVLASIEQAEEVENSFQETFPFHLPREDNRSFLLTQFRLPRTKIIFLPTALPQSILKSPYTSPEPQPILESPYTSPEPQPILEVYSSERIEKSYFTVEEFIQPLAQKVRALQAEGKNLSRAEAGRLLGLQLINWKAEGKNLSRADEERLIGYINQLMKDSNPSDRSVEATTPSTTTPLSLPERFRPKE